MAEESAPAWLSRYKAHFPSIPDKWANIFFWRDYSPVAKAIDCCTRCYNREPSFPLPIADTHWIWRRLEQWGRKLGLRPSSIPIEPIECCTSCTKLWFTDKGADWDPTEITLNDVWEGVWRTILGLFLLWVLFMSAYYLTKWFRRGGRKIGLNFTGLWWVLSLWLVMVWIPDSMILDGRVGVLCGALVGLKDGWDYYWEELIAKDT